MRLALISDIHGNYTALDVVLTDIEQQRVDSIVCLGDVATIGPQPREVIDRLRDLGCPCIMGNHENALLAPEKASIFQIAPPLIPSLYWCASQLSLKDFNYLNTFEPVLEIPLDKNNNLLCFHGSPRSNTDVILATTPSQDLEGYLDGYINKVMTGGHSHIQMLRQYEGKIIVNPGSVGNPFLKTPLPGADPLLMPWSEYALLEWCDRKINLALQRVSYDVGAYCEIISKSNVPIKSWLLQQYGAKGNQ
jgi:predicted phosphodiesterase